MTYFKNITVINSGDKPDYLHSEQPFMMNYLPHDVHIEDFYIDTYTGAPQEISQIQFYLNTEG